MSEEIESGTEGQASDAGPMPDVIIQNAKNKADWATLIGLLFAVGMVFFAIWMGQSDAQFFNTPSFLIVVVGTLAATAVSFTTEEIGKSWNVIRKSIFRRVREPEPLCKALLSMAVAAKKKGVLSLSSYDVEMRKYPFLHRSFQLVIDGFQPDDIARILDHEIDAIKDRHKRSASITQRAAEVAPAMGLIGTLVGLVQMLADLENPETIGPSMALALLTTFYGAILGTVVMAPLSVKLEKNSKDEVLTKTLVRTAATSIARQENPRRLEMLLNAELPPAQQIKFFD